ncbi:hypothetical protein HID58_017778, partial [Brassica napus]
FIMSENKSLTLINGLRPFKSKWRLQVKVIRSWKQTPPYADETLEFVLADQTGVKIHATCPRAHMFRTQRNLPLGEWRVIENFKISGVGKGKYRPTSHQYKMTITSETVFTGSDHQDDNPFLTLANYENILNGKENSNVLIDILGHPYDVGAVQIVQVNHEDRKRIQFRMRDISGNNLACCLWGSYAEQIENSVQELDPSNTVWLLRFAKIGEFLGNDYLKAILKKSPNMLQLLPMLGEIQITNAFDASLLDLNPTMAEAVDFKRRIEENSIALPITDKKHDKREIIPHADDWDDVGISMISEISEISELDQTKIVCSVKAIDTDWAWYYFGCTRCKHGVTRLSGKGSKSDKPLFRCPGKCRANVSNVEPRFKLHLIVEDDTGTCKLLLLNSVAKSIVGSEAVDLWDGSYEEANPEILPQPIRDLVGKSFCFGITTSSDGADIFKVTQVWSGDIIEKIESQSEPLTQIEGGSSCLSSGGLQITMKRKRGDGYGNDNENVTPNAHKIQTANRIRENRNDNRTTNLSSASVPVRSIFRRVLHEIGSSPGSISSFNQAYQQTTMSPQTPNHIPVRLFGVDLMSNRNTNTPMSRSCLTSLHCELKGIEELKLKSLCVMPNSSLTSAQTTHSKRHKDTPISVLNDITNISHSLANTEHGSSSGKSLNPTQDKATVEGICDGEDELDFDCSSQESTDSENMGLDTDGFDLDSHATPATDPYRPEPFCMEKILKRCQQAKSKSTTTFAKRKEEGSLKDNILNKLNLKCGGVMTQCQTLNNLNSYSSFSQVNKAIVTDLSMDSKDLVGLYLISIIIPPSTLSLAESQVLLTFMALQSDKEINSEKQKININVNRTQRKREMTNLLIGLLPSYQFVKEIRKLQVNIHVTNLNPVSATGYKVSVVKKAHVLTVPDHLDPIFYI